jgi:hypothetical protein
LKQKFKEESGDGGSGTPPRPVSMALTLSDDDKATVATVVLVASGSTMSPGASLTGGVKVAPGGRKEQS